MGALFYKYLLDTHIIQQALQRQNDKDVILSPDRFKIKRKRSQMCSNRVKKEFSDNPVEGMISDNLFQEVSLEEVKSSQSSGSLHRRGDIHDQAFTRSAHDDLECPRWLVQRRQLQAESDSRWKDVEGHGFKKVMLSETGASRQDKWGWGRGQVRFQKG